jgi:hypothetical protein
MLRARFALLPTDALQPHEEVEPHRVEELVADIREEGVFLQPVVADEETRTVLDGHHRLEAARRLDLRLTPVHLVDYEAGEIGLETWRQDRHPPAKDEVVARARKGDLFPPKTTKHLNLDDLGAVPVALRDLR